MKKIIYATATKTNKGCTDLVQLKQVISNQHEYFSDSDRPQWLKIFWVKSGGLDLTISRQHYYLSTDQLVCIPSGHDILADARSLSEVYALTFSADFLLLLGLHDHQPFSSLCKQSVSKDLMVSLESPLPAQMRDILNLTLASPVSECTLNIEILKGVLQVIAVYLSRQCSVAQPFQNAETSDDPLFASFIALLEKHYTSKKTVTDYAKALDVTPAYLGDTVKRASGNSASFYIHQRVIEEAKRLVLSSAPSMKQVAYQIGFMDIAHFSKYFRNQTGMNFTDYKKMWA